MKHPTKHHSQFILLTALAAALAAFVSPSRADVTFEQVTNGLVDWYPLDTVTNVGAALVTYDYLNGRDMILSPAMSASNVIASTRPSDNPDTVSNCFNLSQSGGATVIYYNSKGQDPLTGGGDFLPFCNQINASLNFWIKCNVTSGYQDQRIFGECDTTGGNAGPIWLWGTRSDSNGLDGDKQVHFLFRQKPAGTAEPDLLSDGTFQEPDAAYFWTQGGNYTSNSILDAAWHNFTMTIDSNRVIQIYVDGVRDPGPGTFTNMYNQLTYGTTMFLTNTYYTTNIYPSAGVSNPPPNGYVRWMWNSIFTSGSTVFGGFKRGGITGGVPITIDDIAFWNRQISEDEIMYMVTNGLTGIPITRPLVINDFSADLTEVGQGDFATLRWNVTGASTNAGGLVISGVGDVTAVGLIGSTNVTLGSADTYNFTLTAHNESAAPDVDAMVSVKTFAGVDANWHLIQRFDGVFSDTVNTPGGGVNGNNWVSSQGDFSSSFDKWNVLTVTNNGGVNKVITPRTGYNANIASPSGYDSQGAMSYARLGSLTMAPGQSNTLFFRVSLRETPTFLSDVWSDLDFGAGLTDYTFLGPSGGLGYYGNTGGGTGPYIAIIRNSLGNFDGGPFDLIAHDRDDSGTITNTFSYVTDVDANGLQTNVDYYVWMDVVDRNTHAVLDGMGGTNTVDQALYSAWLQKEGDPTRTLLFSDYRGDRDYVNYNPVNDSPQPYLDKVFFNIGPEDFTAVPPDCEGAYLTTNMIAVDDIYLSKSGFESSIPRLLDLTSIVRVPGSVTINWDSLGSMYGTNTYTIQRKLQLTDPAWTTLTTGLPSGGATTSYTDNTVGASATAYYRIAWP